MTGSIFVASTEIVVGYDDALETPTPFQHLYLVYDADGNPLTTGDQRYIEGGPKGSSLTGNLVITADDTINGSTKELDGNNDGDAEDAEDKNPYTYYNYTMIDLNGRDAFTVWTQMVDFANSIGTPDSDFPTLRDTGLKYPILGFGTNSNSVVNSILSQADINLRDNFTKDDGVGPRIGEFFFPGQNHILDGSGSDELNLFSGSSYLVHDSTGNDTFIVENGADFILQTDSDELSTNTIILKDVDPLSVRLERIGNNLNITGGETDIILLGHFLGNDNNDGFLQIEFNGLTTTKSLSNLTSADLSSPVMTALSNTYWSMLGLFNQIRTVSDPLVLDLNRNGNIDRLETAGINGAYFDIDNDGWAEAMPWLRSSDGFLVHDVDNSGAIENGSEMFGDAATNGFIELKTFDLNNDNVINQFDAVWSDLQVWRDFNSDGISQSDELFTLGDFGITEILIPAGTSPGGSTMTTTSGTMSIYNWTPPIDERNTRYAGDVDMDFRTLFLPELRGYATLPDLRLSNFMNAGENAVLRAHQHS